VLDLRGYSSEDALEELERTMDDAVKQQKERLKVIHGHGSDVLKKTIRSYLARSTYVLNWNPGEPQFGGDGITWITLNS
jgi:DNA mismatch repair protein MutS2